jgi:hypothetical protein
MSADLSSMTLAEAEAWRAGWRAAREEVAIVAEERIRQGSDNCSKSQFGDNLAVWVGDAIRAMEPPA